MTNFSEEFSATHRELSDVRHRVGSWLRRHGQHSQILIGDVEMVLTELAANVIDHTASPWIHVVIRLPGDYITVEVTNLGSAATVPPVEDWGQLSEGTRGRGLRIVRALCADIVVSGTLHQTHVQCDIGIDAETR